jgi:murein L,D-transpeptidase YcbB/YkuD
MSTAFRPLTSDAAQLADSAASLAAGSARDSARAELDVAVTAAIARALRAMHGGRVRPWRVDSALIVLHAPLPLVATLDSAITGGEPRAWLERVQPGVRPYWRLIGALARYREADTTLGLPTAPPRLLKDRPSAAIARLRRRLALNRRSGWHRSDRHEARLGGRIQADRRDRTLPAPPQLPVTASSTA